MILAIMMGMYFAWQYRSGDISKQSAMFSMICVAAIFFFFETIFTIITQESGAKGILIRKDQYPGSYYVSLFGVLCAFVLAVVGIFHFY